MIDCGELKKLLISAGYEPRSYSGRGMFGKHCIGVESGASQAAVKVTLQVVHAAVIDHRYDKQDLEDLLEKLDDVRTDNMGLDMIVYWPNIKWEEGA